MADTAITIKKKSTLRPPNLALRGKKKKNQPTLKNDHTKKGDIAKGEPAPLVKGFLSNTTKLEDMDFFPVVYQASNKFHQEYSLDEFEKYKCGRGESECIASLEKGAKRTVVLDPKDWAFGEADLLTSLNTEENGYSIKDNCLPYVNSKAECIKTIDLLKYHKTHVGAFVLANHKQDLKKVKGLILDVVLREIPLGDGTKIYFSRGLIAVNRKKDPKMAKALEEGKIKFGSMGSFYSSVTCGFCGKVGLHSEKDDTRCIHLKMMKGQLYDKPNGSISQIVEWWNSHDEEGEATPIEFVEYSLLVCQDGSVGGVCRGTNPAWSGSVVSGKGLKALKAEKKVSLEIEEVFLKKPAFQMFLNSGEIKIRKSS